MIVYGQVEWRAGCAAVPAAPRRHPGRPVTQLRLERSEDDAPLGHWWDFNLTFLEQAIVSPLIYEKYYVWHSNTVHTDRFCRYIWLLKKKIYFSLFLSPNQYSGSVTFWNGSGSGSYSFLQWKIDFNWIQKKCFNKWNFKFNFATTISVRSTSLWEKGKIRIPTFDLRIRIREAYKLTDPDPEHCTQLHLYNIFV